MACPNPPRCRPIKLTCMRSMRSCRKGTRVKRRCGEGMQRQAVGSREPICLASHCRVLDVAMQPPFNLLPCPLPPPSNRLTCRRSSNSSTSSPLSRAAALRTSPRFSCLSNCRGCGQERNKFEQVVCCSQLAACNDVRLTSNQCAHLQRDALFPHNPAHQLPGAALEA